MKVSEITDENRTVPANALDVYTFRFANEGESTDIIYTSNNTEYRESARPQLKNIAFYTQPAASESAYIYDGNPFVATEENRTFYVCANAPARYRLTGIAWDDPDLAGLFTVVPDENGAWLEITVKDGVIVPATEPVITCQCVRVPVLNGHTAAVFVKFRKKPTKEQLIQALRDFKGLPQELELPSAPKQFIQYLEEDNRPQVYEDVNYERGMGVSIGRLREDTVYDYKFIGLSHNTVRGAAGGAVLCAETLKAKGFIQPK